MEFIGGKKGVTTREKSQLSRKGRTNSFGIKKKTLKKKKGRGEHKGEKGPSPILGRERKTVFLSRV